METDIFIYGEIGSQYDEEDFLKDTKDTFDTINIHISSQGGAVFPGFAIYNRILALKKEGKKVVAKIEGLCASIATLIALGADEIEMAETAQWLIHNPFNNVVGDASELEREAKRLRSIESQLVEVYRKKTNMNEEEIRSLMNQEEMINAEDALVKYKFIDRKIDAVKAAAMYIGNKDMDGYMKTISKRLDEIVNSLDPKDEEPVNVVELTLRDGGTVYVDSEDGEIEGKSAYVDAGMSEPAPDGVHALEDGREITVADGIVSAVSEAAPPEEDKVKELEAKLEAIKQERDEARAYSEELQKEVANQHQKIEDVQNQIKEVKNMFAGDDKDLDKPKKDFKPKAKEEETYSISDFKY